MLFLKLFSLKCTLNVRACRHPFAGGLGISDVLLRMEHSVGGTGSGRRVASAVVNTSKYFADTSNKMKTSIASWLKGTKTE